MTVCFADWRLATEGQSGRVRVFGSSHLAVFKQEVRGVSETDRLSVCARASS